MNATELYQKGQLQEAIDAQIQVVKGKPADQSLRLFLFELLAFAGELDRAQKQIDVLKYEDPDLQLATLNYRKLLDAERARRRVFHEGIAPQFPGEAPEHVKVRLEALQQLRGGNQQLGKELLDRADAAAPTVTGTLNGKPFDLFRDCDDLFGPILEVMVHGNYFWVPVEQIDQIVMNPPKFPRDLIWAPARLQTKQGNTGDVFLPVLYPDSYAHADAQVKLGRFTDWSAPEAGPVRGVGARLFLWGDDAIHLLELRQVLFHDPAEQGPPNAGPPPGDAPTAETT